MKTMLRVAQFDWLFDLAGFFQTHQHLRFRSFLFRTRVYDTFGRRALSKKKHTTAGITLRNELIKM